MSFFNSIRGLLSSSAANFVQPAPLESYEREAADSDEAADEPMDLELPDREHADLLIETYFSTIHVAYPFLYKQQFMEGYQSSWQSTVNQNQLSWFQAQLRKYSCLVMDDQGSYQLTASR